MRPSKPNSVTTNEMAEACRFPIEVHVKQRNYGAERSINVIYEDADYGFVETQDWRFKVISICGDLREEYAIDALSESKTIGYVEVDPETFGREFVKTARISCSQRAT